MNSSKKFDMERKKYVKTNRKNIHVISIKDSLMPTIIKELNFPNETCRSNLRKQQAVIHSEKTVVKCLPHLRKVINETVEKTSNPPRDGDHFGEDNKLTTMTINTKRQNHDPEHTVIRTNLNKKQYYEPSENGSLKHITSHGKRNTAITYESPNKLKKKLTEESSMVQDNVADSNTRLMRAKVKTIKTETIENSSGERTGEINTTLKYRIMVKEDPGYESNSNIDPIENENYSESSSHIFSKSFAKDEREILHFNKLKKRTKKLNRSKHYEPQFEELIKNENEVRKVLVNNDFSQNNGNNLVNKHADYVNNYIKSDDDRFTNNSTSSSFEFLTKSPRSSSPNIEFHDTQLFTNTYGLPNLDNSNNKCNELFEKICRQISLMANDLNNDDLLVVIVPKLTNIEIDLFRRPKLKFIGKFAIKNDEFSDDIQYALFSMYVCCLIVNKTGPFLLYPKPNVSLSRLKEWSSNIGNTTLIQQPNLSSLCSLHRNYKLIGGELESFINFFEKARRNDLVKLIVKYGEIYPIAKASEILGPFVDDAIFNVTFMAYDFFNILYKDL